MASQIWCDEKQAAEVAGYSVATLRKRRVEGGGPVFYKEDGANKVRYKMADILAWVETQRRGTTAEYETWQKGRQTQETVAS